MHGTYEFRNGCLDDRNDFVRINVKLFTDFSNKVVACERGNNIVQIHNLII
jgi:hypothetical protein